MQLQSLYLRASLSLAALLCGFSAPAPCTAQARTSEFAVASAKMSLESESGASSKNLFSSNDKDLRKSVIRSKKEIIEEIPATAPVEFRSWMIELLTTLERNDFTASSQILGQSHKLPATAIRQILRSFALVQANEYDFMDDEAQEVRNRTRLVADINGALDEVSDSPLLLQFAAFTINQANVCDLSLLALPSKTPNPASSFRTIAAVTGCSGPLLEALKTDPSHRVADLALLSEILQNQPTLNLWLLRPEALQKVAPESQSEFNLALTRKAISDAFNYGADARGLALYDALDQAGRRAMQADNQDEFTATIDGVPIHFGAKDSVGLTTSLAAAMYLAGRIDEARFMIESSPQLLVEREFVDCLYNIRTAKDTGRVQKACGGENTPYESDQGVDRLILLWALNAQKTDPYPILEAAFSGTTRSNPTTPIARLYCAVFDVNVAGSVCANARRSVAYDLLPTRYENEEEILARAALVQMDLPEWSSIAASIESERLAGLSAFDDRRGPVVYSNQPPIEPDYPAFAQSALPSELISVRSDENSEDANEPAWPKGWADLPKGFEPVRWQGEGNRVVAISQSGLIDRGGEVGRGGYWIHLSSDLGKTWGQPIYTGLAAHFPYVVETSSKMPLLNRDRLQIEVTYALLDTSSISYPPVGLRTLRRQPNLWLDIPIAALTKDIDGDGITDIVASHLGLSGPAEEAPFIVGSDKAICAGTDLDPVVSIRRKILLMLTGIDEAAIREPIDRPSDAPLLSGITRISTGTKWPLFVKGIAKDLACMPSLPMSVFVYGPQGEKAMQRRSPDFSLIELPSIVLNREKSRGYAIWSSGWTGGTIMFWLKEGKWQFETISSWIT